MWSCQCGITVLCIGANIAVRVCESGFKVVYGVDFNAVEIAGRVTMSKDGHSKCWWE